MGEGGDDREGYLVGMGGECVGGRRVWRVLGSCYMCWGCGVGEEGEGGGTLQRPSQEVIEPSRSLPSPSTERTNKKINK